MDKEGVYSNNERKSKASMFTKLVIYYLHNKTQERKQNKKSARANVYYTIIQMS